LFILDLTGKEPIYEQLRSQLLKYLELGIIKAGTKIPSVRDTAKNNGINPNTVQKAYRALEAEGYLYAVPKKGVYVAEIDVDKSRQEMLYTFLRPLRGMGVTREEIIAIVNYIYEEEVDAKGK